MSILNCFNDTLHKYDIFCRPITFPCLKNIIYFNRNKRTTIQDCLYECIYLLNGRLHDKKTHTNRPPSLIIFELMHVDACVCLCNIALLA